MAFAHDIFSTFLLIQVLSCFWYYFFSTILVPSKSLIYSHKKLQYINLFYFYAFENNRPDRCFFFWKLITITLVFGTFIIKLVNSRYLTTERRMWLWKYWLNLQVLLSILCKNHKGLLLKHVCWNCNNYITLKIIHTCFHVVVLYMKIDWICLKLSLLIK